MKANKRPCNADQGASDVAVRCAAQAREPSAGIAVEEESDHYAYGHVQFAFMRNLTVLMDHSLGHERKPPLVA